MMSALGTFIKSLIAGDAKRAARRRQQHSEIKDDIEKVRARIEPLRRLIEEMNVSETEWNRR